MNIVDRHLEQSEIWDSSLYERVFQKEEGVEAVSYTHLDVYKRQGYMIVNSHMSHIRKLSHMKNYKMEH